MNSHEHTHASTECRRPQPPRALLLSILAQVPVSLLLWPPSHSPVPVSLGIAMLTAGSVLNVWSVTLFRKNDTGLCPFSQVNSLVGSGPYRISRNPMYLGLVLISGGVALATGFSWNLWAAAALALYLHYGFVVREEAFLREQFGVRYLEYASRASRWLGLPVGQAIRAEADRWPRS